MEPERIELARAWWTRGTRDEGGRATHLVRVTPGLGGDDRSTLCGLRFDDRINFVSVGPALTATEPDPLTDCRNCARSIAVTVWRRQAVP